MTLLNSERLATDIVVLHTPISVEVNQRLDTLSHHVMQAQEDLQRVCIGCPIGL